MSNTSSKNNFPWKSLIYAGTVLLITVIVLLFSYLFFKSTINAPNEIINKSMNSIASYFSEKRQIGVRIANLIEDSHTAKFQFKKRDILLVFQIIRWRDKDSGLELVETKPQIIQLDEKNILLGQYTTAQANGNFEITFTMNLAKCSDWQYSWEPNTSTLNISLPAFKEPFVACNSPALIDPLDIFIKTDCATFDEDTTLKMLKKKIPALKQIGAERQIPFIREDARKALEDFLHNLISGMSKSQNLHFRVNVIFADDKSNIMRKL